MLAWTTSTMNAVRASESARATRAGGKARGTHRIATRRDARDADGVECVIRVELRAWTTIPRRRMTARGRNANRNISFVRVVSDGRRGFVVAPIARANAKRLHRARRRGKKTLRGGKTHTARRGARDDGRRDED
jgi:hypothetical protein